MDHKIIGIRYLVTAIVFLVLGGLEALVMRVQLAHADAAALARSVQSAVHDARRDDAVPVRAARAVGVQHYLWPLMIGARDMAFPRVNAVGYWLFLAAGIFLYTSFPLACQRRLVQLCPARFVPLSAGPNIDFFALGMIFLGIRPRPARSTSSSPSSRCGRPACRSTGCRSCSGAR